MLILSLLKRGMLLGKTADISTCKSGHPVLLVSRPVLFKKLPMVMGMLYSCDLCKSSPGRLLKNKEVVHLKFYLILLSTNSHAPTVMGSIGLDIFFFFLYYLEHYTNVLVELFVSTHLSSLY